MNLYYPNNMLRFIIHEFFLNKILALQKFALNKIRNKTLYKNFRLKPSTLKIKSKKYHSIKFYYFFSYTFYNSIKF
jgi:hypothetical protein